MKIYLKRDKSDEKSRYIVYTENGDELYRIIGESKGHTERAYVMCKENCVLKIRDTRLFMLRTCYVNSKDESFHIVVTSASGKTAISFHGIDYHIRGDILKNSYDIMNIENSVVCCVSRKYVTHADAIELNIFDNKHLLSCIACAMFLDSVCTIDAMALQTT